MKSEAWQSIFERYELGRHDFSRLPYLLTRRQIREGVSHRKDMTRGMLRSLVVQPTRESRPQVFKKHGLFLLRVANGRYCILQGEGYVDIPPITTPPAVYQRQLDFDLETSRVGSSEMQHLDYAYATSLVRTFLDDSSLVLTIRGRKYTPEFAFRVGPHDVHTRGVQTEVDAGYEGRHQVVLVEAKNTAATNTIIRQLFYPLRQWTEHTRKPIQTLFFARSPGEIYQLWHFRFADPADYNSIELVRSQAFRMV